TLKENNLFFDDRYFMYCEDFDLIRRIHRVAKTVYYPNVTIVHDHAKESYKNKKMLMIHIKSAIKYFNKFGWIFDKERNFFNILILKEIEDLNKS
ncbi:MAG: glycosyltransferase family 2 protein, partial [Treponema sp.]|nr:glycosyltransferase family 2 protein [Treponema sp.]